MGYYFSDEDTTQLLREVDAMKVVDFLGIPSKKVGACFSILCPDPGHSDTHYGNCVYRSRSGRFHCYCCDKSFDALDLLRLAGGYGFYDAMCVLAELSGRPEDFQKNKNGRKKPQKRLTRDQKTLLGLAETASIRSPYGISFQKPDALCEKEGDYYLLFHTSRGYNPWASLDDDTIGWLIRNKCEERLLNICGAFKQAKGLKNEGNLVAGELSQAYLDEFRQVRDVYRAYGGTVSSYRDLLASIGQ